MKIVHTGDWHIGKVLLGKQRLEEFTAILQEIKTYLIDNQIDIIIVAGDVFDTGMPSAEAEKLVYDFFHDISQYNIKSIVIAGNHDSDARFEALSNLMKLANVTMRGFDYQNTEPSKVRIEKNGEIVDIVLLPFISEKHFLQSSDLKTEHPQDLYSIGMGKILQDIANNFDSNAVNIVVSHILIHGAKSSGSEKRLYLGQNYALHPEQIPQNIDYFALGHIHYEQKMDAPCPTYYSGSCLQLDFGEADTPKGFLLLDTKQERPFVPQFIELTSGKKLIALQGTWDDLQEKIQNNTIDIENNYVAVEVLNNTTILPHQIQETFPNALKIVSKHPKEPVELKTQTADWIPELFKKYYHAQAKKDILEQVIEEFNHFYALCSK
jgi:exonuclease SbcD